MNDDTLAPLHRMTPDEQIRQQTGPGSEDKPGFVVVDPGPRAWFRDDDGQWRKVDDDETEGGKPMTIGSMATLLNITRNLQNQES